MRIRAVTLGLSLALACSDDGSGRDDSSSATNVTTAPTTAPPTTGAPTTTDAAATGSSSAPDGTTTDLETGEPGSTSGHGTTLITSFFTTDGGEITGFDSEGVECDSTLKATIRDFKVEHPDFEDFTGDAATKGLVLTTLGPDNKPVHASPGPTGQTSGPDTYAQWYNDIANVNIPFAIDLTLSEVMPGLYSYQNSAFFPIDGQGWNNEGNPHNFHFTTEIHTTFVYKGGEVFTFTGDDDLWLFINGTLAIDLGGTHPQLSDTVDLDAQAATLGIAVGGTYPMDIFHAERHTDQSNFRIDTSISCFLIPG